MTLTYRFKRKPINPIKAWKRGYIAGMLDGDGNIGLPSTVFGGHRIRVTITNQCLPMLEQLVSWTGGFIQPPKLACSLTCTELHVHRRRPTYRFHAQGMRGYILLGNIYPYLVVKQERATVVLNYPINLEAPWSIKIIKDMLELGWRTP